MTCLVVRPRFYRVIDLTTTFSLLAKVTESVKADLHGTTLSHTTSLRQAYDVTLDLNGSRKQVVGLIYKKQCSRPVVSLSYATMSYRVNRP